MTRKELENLPVGTLLFNGRTEAVVKMDGKVKVLEIYIPICGMSSDSNDYNERPEWWEVLDE